MHFTGAAPSVCLIDGVTVTPVAAGLCVVIATQEGNATVNPATPVSQRFTVAGQHGGVVQRIFLPLVARKCTQRGR